MKINNPDFMKGKRIPIKEGNTPQIKGIINLQS